MKSRVSDDNEDVASSSASEKSVVAREVDDLQRTILRLARDRERLPQPLFWSLFNSRLRDIKKQKELRRLLKETLGEAESE